MKVGDIGCRYLSFDDDATCFARAYGTQIKRESDGGDCRFARNNLASLYLLSGYREVGEATARALAQHFLTLDELMAAPADILEGVDDVGPIVARHIRAFASDDRNRGCCRAAGSRGHVAGSHGTGR